MKKYDCRLTVIKNWKIEKKNTDANPGAWFSLTNTSVMPPHRLLFWYKPLIRSPHHLVFGYKPNASVQSIPHCLYLVLKFCVPGMNYIPAAQVPYDKHVHIRTADALRNTCTTLANKNLAENGSFFCSSVNISSDVSKIVLHIHNTHASTQCSTEERCLHGQCVAQIQCGIVHSVAVLAETSLRSPRKLFIFIIKIYIYRNEVPPKKII